MPKETITIRRVTHAERDTLVMHLLGFHIKTLEDQDTYLYIAEKDSVPIGLARVTQITPRHMGIMPTTCAYDGKETTFYALAERVIQKADSLGITNLDAEIPYPPCSTTLLPSGKNAKQTTDRIVKDIKAGITSEIIGEGRLLHITPKIAVPQLAKWLKKKGIERKWVG